MTHNPKIEAESKWTFPCHLAQINGCCDLIDGVVTDLSRSQDSETFVLKICTPEQWAKNLEKNKC